MEIVPVLDLMGGVVVRGVGGRRAEYQPVRSILCDRPDPIAVAEAFRERLGLGRLYLADLDAIAGAPPSAGLFSELARRGFSLLVDAGLRSAAEAAPLEEAGVDVVVAGLESIAGPAVLEGLLARLGDSRVLFSLDLRGGEPIVGGRWSSTDPAAIAEEAVAAGVRQVLLLDLARVGVGEGPGTVDLAESLLARWPAIRLYLGGGVRRPADLAPLARLPLAAVLVASALHDGSLTRSDISSKDRH